MIRLILATLCCVVLSANAEARQRHRAVHLQAGCVLTNDVMRPMVCDPGLFAGIKSIRVEMKRERHRRVSVVKTGKNSELVALGSEQPNPKKVAIWQPAQIIAHPAGCPARAFCGCGAAVRIFGKPIRDLWLAANWFRFPRTAPSAGMVAVRKHHVFVLEQHLGGDRWLAYDANSGRHLTRLHPRSIAGYAIVNPRAGV